MTERVGISEGAAPSEEFGAIGFELDRIIRRGGLGDHEVRGPDRALVRRAEAAPRKEGLALWQPLGLDEEFVESGMRAIGPMRRERELEITGQFHLAGFARSVDQGEAPDFGIVFRGNDNFRHGFTRTAAPPELRFVRRETPGVAALRTSHRLMGIAPDRAALQITQVTDGARRIAGGVSAPAGHIQIEPAQIATAGVRHGHRAGPVGEHVNTRRRDVGRLCHDRGADDRNRARRRTLFMYLTSGRQNLFRNVLVQERLGGAYARVGMETSPHGIAV